MVNQCTVKSFKLFEKMFNMSFTVLDMTTASRRCLHSSMLLLIKMPATVCSTQPPKQVSVGQRSQIGDATLFINYVIMRHHKHVHRIVNCIEQLIVNK